MTSSIEKLEGLKRKLTVKIPKESVQEAYQKSLEKTAKTAKIKGFRPGKIPLQVVEKQFGKSIRAEVAGDLMQSSFQEAVDEHQIRVAGQPEVNPEELEKGKEFKYEAIFEIYPEIEFKDLDGESINKEVAEVSGEDLNEMLEKLSKQHANWKEANRPAEEGDRLDIDFEGFIDDKPFEGGKAKNFQLELGSKQMIAGFEEGLIGAKPHEEMELKVTFPEQYPVEDLASKPAVFKIKINKIEEPELPELNDEFAKKLGFEDIEALKKQVRNSLEMELEQVIQGKLKTEVLERLLKLNQLSVPDALIDSEVEHLQQMTRQQVAIQQGLREAPEMELAREPFLKEAEKRVSLGLLLAEAIQVYQIKIDKDKVRDKINQIAASYKKPEEVVAWYYKNKQLMSEIEASVLEDQVVGKLLEKAKINEIARSYKEVMELTTKDQT